jgi:hypothetical protein
VLDDVERRRFLVQPAREHSLPAPVGALDIQLHEGARQILVFPRRRRFARAQADDGVLDAHRLAGPQRNVAYDAVALVEQAEHRDPLRHRRDSRLGPRRRPRRSERALLGRLRLLGLAAGLPAAVAAGGAQAKEKQESRPASHAQSGVHGW